jgi:transcription elongation factor GreA
MSHISYYSAEGLAKLKYDLHFLTTHERASISKQIQEARDKGDLSENAEYDAAKEAQGMLELKIAKLKEIVSNARLLEDGKLNNEKVMILTTVKIKNLNNNQEMQYTIVAESEANLKEGKISIDSPIGQGLVGKKVGDKVEIKVPAGIIPFQVINISI